MTEIQRPTCATCRFWEADYYIDDAPSTMGRCHRYAPKPNATQVPDADATWPMTRGDDWCGEWLHSEAYFAPKADPQSPADSAEAPK